MVIGIDASRANASEKTGVGWYAYHIIQSLKSLTPSTVRVILYSPTPLEGELAVLPAHWESHVLRWPPGRLWTQVRLSWEMFRHPPDVLFVPSHIVPLVHPKKTVTMIHDIAAKDFSQSYGPFERWYTIWGAELAVKNLWRILVPSEAVKKDLSALALRAAPRPPHMITIPHGYDEAYAEHMDVSMCTATLNTFHLRTPFFLSIGRLEEKKNTAQLVRAFTRLRDLHPEFIPVLVLVGQPGYGHEATTQAVAESPYKSDIRLLGWQPTDVIVPLLQSATAFVFPSITEGFGLPVLEAIASGAPVVASDIPVLHEVAGEAALFVDPHSSDDLVTAMHRLLLDQDLRTALRQKGYERIKQFSWKKSAEATLDVLLSK